MSEPIKPNATQTFYNTTIPSLTDDANIQEALRMYHYGTSDGSIPDDSGNPIQAESIASYLGGLQTQIDGFGIGSEYSSTEPSLTNDDNGYIWVDSNSSALIFDEGIPTIAFYQSAEPTTGLVAGMLWVDSDDNAVYVYSGTAWVSVASGSGGGSSYTPPNSFYLNYDTGANGVLSINEGATLMQSDNATPLGASLTVSAGFTRSVIELDGQFIADTDPEVNAVIAIQRSTDLVNWTTVGSVITSGIEERSNGAYQQVFKPFSFRYIDTHGASTGTTVYYTFVNITGTTSGVGSVTCRQWFDGVPCSLSVREVA